MRKKRDYKRNRGGNGRSMRVCVKQKKKRKKWERIAVEKGVEKRGQSNKNDQTKRWERKTSLSVSLFIPFSPPPFHRASVCPFTVPGRGPSVIDYSFNGIFTSAVAISPERWIALVRGSWLRSVKEYIVACEHLRRAPMPIRHFLPISVQFLVLR